MPSLKEQFEQARDSFRKDVGCAVCKLATGKLLGIFGDCSGPGWEPFFGTIRCKHLVYKPETEYSLNSNKQSIDACFRQ